MSESDTTTILNEPPERKLPPQIQRLFDRLLDRAGWWKRRRVRLAEYQDWLSAEIDRADRAIEIVKARELKISKLLFVLETGRKPASWRKRIYSPSFGVTHGATTKPLAYMHSAGGEEGSGGLENAVRALEDAR